MKRTDLNLGPVSRFEKSTSQCFRLRYGPRSRTGRCFECLCSIHSSFPFHLPLSAHTSASSFIRYQSKREADTTRYSRLESLYRDLAFNPHRLCIKGGRSIGLPTETQKNRHKMAEDEVDYGMEVDESDIWRDQHANVIPIGGDDEDVVDLEDMEVDASLALGNGASPPNFHNTTNWHIISWSGSLRRRQGKG